MTNLDRVPWRGPFSISMASRRIDYPIEPMTLGNMRGLRSLAIYCWQCHLPTFGPRMVCTGCGIISADARPNWKEQPPRETLTGVQGEAEQ
jgi:hypothetical protein